MTELPPSEACRVAILDGSGRCINVTLLEPGADWDPGEGLLTKELDEDSPVGPGHVWDGASWSVPDAPPDPEPAPVEAPVVDPALVEAWQDATTIAQLRAAGVNLFAALGLTPAA